MNDRAEAIAAATVNGGLVVLAPAVLFVAGAAVIPDNSVRPADYPWFAKALAIAAQIAMGVSPFGMLAAWRTFVYARRRRERHDSGWGAVFEAGACGLGIAVLVLARGIMFRPREALPALAVYGTAAVLIGLLAGLLLRTTALIVLRICRDWPAAGAPA